MARAPQQSAGPITIWMIVFAALWLTSTVFLIILYTGQQELVSENERNQRDVKRLISDRERQSIELIRNLSDGGATAVGILEAARRETALLASGEETDIPATIRAKRDKQFEEIQREGLVPEGEALKDVSVLAGMKRLGDWYAKDRERLTVAQKQNEELEAEVQTLQSLTADQKKAFDQKVAEMEAKLDEAEAQRAAYRTQRDKSVEDLEKEFEARRAQNDADLTRERLRNNQIEQQLNELRQRFAAREEKFGSLLIGPQALTTARQPDGKVLTAVPGDDMIYIDLGRRDRLALGLRFAVYPAGETIPADGRSKGQVEVVSISEGTAECKVVSAAPNTTIFENDLIANPIYDRSQPQTFLVIGEFDVNRDGLVDPGGAGVVESMITEWGGVLTQELTADTDFVVVGSRPRQPKPASERDVTPEQAERNARMQKAWDRYMEVLASAKALSVPVLTQDLFFNFLGYRRD